MSQSADLSTRFRRLALINVLSNLTIPLAGLVDTAMLGHLDEIRFLAGTALASVLFDYLLWSFAFLRMGTTGLVARACGRGDEGAAATTLARGLIIAVLAGLTLVVAASPLAALGFTILDGGAAVEAAGRDYFFARILGAPATLSGYVLLGYFLGREQPGRALTHTVIVNFANITLNWLFIIELGLAARGAGLATAGSQWLGLIVCLPLLRSGGVWPRPRLSELGRDLAGFWALNRDITIRTWVLVSVFAAFLNLSARFGTVALAANAILNRVQNLAAYLIDGAAFATETLAGQLEGAGRRPEQGRVLWLAFGFAEIVTALLLLPVLIAPKLSLSLLTNHAEVLELSGRLAPWLVPVLGLGALAFVLDGYFVGLADGRSMRNAMLIAAAVGFVPLAVLATRLESLHLLWAAMALFMAARTATLAWPAWKRLRNG